MTRRPEATKAYEARIVGESLIRLAARMERATVPFSDAELRTLALRARQSFRAFRSPEKKARLARYRQYLAERYGVACVESVWAALVQINNEIGYEEK